MPVTKLGASISLQWPVSVENTYIENKQIDDVRITLGH